MQTDITLSTCLKAIREVLHELTITSDWYAQNVLPSNLSGSRHLDELLAMYGIKVYRDNAQIIRISMDGVEQSYMYYKWSDAYLQAFDMLLEKVIVYAD
jgi:hypothetical protein